MPDELPEAAKEIQRILAGDGDAYLRMKSYDVNFEHAQLTTETTLVNMC